MEQKQAQASVTNQSTIHNDQTQISVVQNQNLQQNIHSQNPLISQEVTQNISNEQISSSIQKDLPAEIKNYENIHEDQSHQYQSYQMDQQNLEQQHVDQQANDFDKFNDVEINQVSMKNEIRIQERIIEEKPIKNISSTNLQEEPIKKVESSIGTNNFAAYQNSQPIETKPLQSQQKQETVKQKVALPQKDFKKKKSKKKNIQQSEPLPIITADSKEGKQQIKSEKKIQQIKSVDTPVKVPESNNSEGDTKPSVESKVETQAVAQSRVSEIKQDISEILEPTSVAAGLIIFQAQRERIGTTLQHFLKYTAKHQRHTTNQKQLITNVEQEIQKKRVSKNPICNALRDYFEDFSILCKDLYQRSYKFAKSQKVLSANPMINMRQELKGGIDELIFLRKATGNEYNRLGEFISSNMTKNVIKLYSDYWKSIGLAQSNHKVIKEQFYKKQKDFLKRINKVIKVYTKGKVGSSQQQDLFIEMIKFINQQKQYRGSLIQYGLSLIPLKKALIKAQQVLYEQVQLLFNTFKNQFRTLYSIHPKEFVQIEKMQKFIKDSNTFEKLSDITDGDYVRSVLLVLQKGTVHELSDKQFEKVLNMYHFEQIIGQSVQLLKGTTTKSFELKNKAQQVVDTVSGNLLIFNKQSAQMKQKFIIKNIDARIVQYGVVQIDQVLKGIIFDSHRTVRITFRDNDRAQQLICFLNQVHQNIKENQLANSKK